MSFTQKVQVVGVKRSKGTLDNGTEFDSTKAFIILPMDTRKGDALGASAEGFNIGTSVEFERWKDVKFPCLADGTFEMVTNGSSMKLIVTSLQPAAPASKG